ncbi:MAG: hypothetical protein PHD48_06835 [Alphaproteobacteria bacterium]|nr:hypothetical protein [Alphaproteobacteria bacterium]
MRIAVLCGGPSAERGISLNSGRSLLDHLSPLGWDIIPYYCDRQKNFYRLSQSQIYSNTPSDFDFKLASTSTAMNEDQFVAALKEADLVFPAIHGEFGEDGTLQELLEKNNIPFVGSPSSACRKMFDKGDANALLAQHGFATLPNCILKESDTQEVLTEKLTTFFKKNHIDQAVIKPSAGGSSLGIAITHSAKDALAKTLLLFAQNHGPEAMIEPYCDGHEFTVLTLENEKGEPVALIPTEIELTGEDSSIFSFRHKYLPTCHVSYFCPPRFSDAIVGHIQKAAEVLFSFFGMRDFARLDGWLFKDGSILFSDFNPISGMEQNSFLFIQGTRVGMTHGDILAHIVQSAARRHNLPCSVKRETKKPNAQNVNVLFGGETAERQVSLMSGTNVWLKLLHSPEHKAVPHLLSLDGDVWRLPYSYTLQHTVEEVLFHCKDASRISRRLQMLVPPLRLRLGIGEASQDVFAVPQQMSLETFYRTSQRENAFVFLGLHGGFGEDGRIQELLDSYDLPYNGPGADSSAICADKNKTAEIVTALADPDLIAAPKLCFALKNSKDDIQWLDALWKEATTKLQSSDLLIKPQNDGCSTGVVRLYCAEDLGKFLKALRAGERLLLPGTLNNQVDTIELSANPDQLMLEPFIVTDEIRFADKKLVHLVRTNWIELTVGVIEENGQYHALTPSITVAEGNVLSLEEKFQGGTGINLTPPPSSIMTEAQIKHVREKTEKASKALGIEGYSRLDLFFNTATNQTLLIEANTLPGLTAATVIFHQAFAEKPPLCPQAFLALLVQEGLSRHTQRQRIKTA